MFVAMRLENARHEAFLAELPSGDVGEALFFAKLIVQAQGIFPIEATLGGRFNLAARARRGRAHLSLSIFVFLIAGSEITGSCIQP